MPKNGLEIAYFFTGNRWSFNAKSQTFVVSPVPDVYERILDIHSTPFIILASDGLWNVVNPQEALDLLHTEKKVIFTLICSVTVIK